ncbi:MAG: hypothetical protein MHM6MM_002955 [Cercozoa sp. M6MM]
MFLLGLCLAALLASSVRGECSVRLPHSPRGGRPSSVEVDADQRGCFEWHTDRKDLLQIQGVGQGCGTQRAHKVKVTATSSAQDGRLRAMVWATDTQGRRVQQCRVHLDTVARIQLLKRTHTFDVNETESLSVQAFDLHDNVFSSLSGLDFAWALGDTSLVVLHTTGGSTASLTGKRTGKTDVTVTLQSRFLDEAQIGTRATVVIAERVDVAPSPLRLPPASVFQLALTSADTAIRLPSSTWHFVSEKPSVVSLLDAASGVLHTQDKDRSTVSVFHKGLAQEDQKNPPSTVVHVSDVEKLGLVFARDAITGYAYEIQVPRNASKPRDTVYVRHASRHVVSLLMLAASETLLDVPDNFEFDYDVTDDCKQVLTMEKAGRNTMRMSVSVSPSTTLPMRCQLTVSVGTLIDEETEQRYVVEKSIVRDVIVTDDVVVPRSHVLLPWTGQGYTVGATLPLHARGGSGSYTYAVRAEESPCVRVDARTGAVRQVLREGSCDVVVSDAHDATNFFVVRAEVSQPQRVVFGASRREFLAGQDVSIPVGITDAQGRSFDLCSYEKPSARRTSGSATASLRVLSQTGWLPSRSDSRKQQSAKDAFVDENGVAVCAILRVADSAVGKSEVTVAWWRVSAQVATAAYKALSTVPAVSDLVVSEGGSVTVPLTGGAVALSRVVRDVRVDTEHFRAEVHKSHKEHGLTLTLSCLRSNLRDGVRSLGDIDHVVSVVTHNRQNDHSCPLPVEVALRLPVICVKPFAVRPSHVLQLGPSTEKKVQYSHTYPSFLAQRFVAASDDEQVAKPTLSESHVAVRGGTLGRTSLTIKLAHAIQDTRLVKTLPVQVQFTGFTLPSVTLVQHNAVLLTVQGASGESPAWPELRGAAVRWRLLDTSDSSVARLTAPVSLRHNEWQSAEYDDREQFSIRVEALRPGAVTVEARVLIAQVEFVATSSVTIVLPLPALPVTRVLLPPASQYSASQALQSEHSVTGSVTLGSKDSGISMDRSFVVTSGSTPSDNLLKFETELQTLLLPVQVRPVQRLLVSVARSDSSSRHAALCVGDVVAVDVLAQTGTGEVFTSTRGSKLRRAVQVTQLATPQLLLPRGQGEHEDEALLASFTLQLQQTGVTLLHVHVDGQTQAQLAPVFARVTVVDCSQLPAPSSATKPSVTRERSSQHSATHDGGFDGVSGDSSSNSTPMIVLGVVLSNVGVLALAYVLYTARRNKSSATGAVDKKVPAIRGPNAKALVCSTLV